ncbi:MAG: hypothetical protein KF773_11955 [Deltaproteobacteria bacterium]|nr:hypothetical protein [Deltaproteobacteria bacterium]
MAEEDDQEKEAPPATCARCAEAERAPRSDWCAACDGAFDVWSRRYATDILWACLGGGVIVCGVALGLPLLGVNFLVAVSGVFAGFGTLYGGYRWNRQRRRRQFLEGAAVPRAYLPEGRRR